MKTRMGDMRILQFFKRLFRSQPELSGKCIMCDRMMELCDEQTRKHQQTMDEQVVALEGLLRELTSQQEQNLKLIQDNILLSFENDTLKNGPPKNTKHLN
mgnify:CR=1 FL=1